ncbi:MAG TPA: hypothetical protein VL326_25420, partial [Kofleriaceae bacterium]|nr:hypothetical protein [Kofleriaceae bacterium]
TIRNADLIVVMDKGKVVETGTYAQLAQKGGLFTQLLAASQSASTPGSELGYEAAFAARNASPAGSSLRNARNGAQQG